MLTRLSAIVAGLGVLATSANAQPSPEATVYGHANFRGGGMVLTGPREKMDPIQVESVQLSPGSVWELCSGRTFTGCKQFSASRKSMIMTVRSARPVGSVIPEDASASVAGLKGNGKSLRGLASEFFVTPVEGGNRVEVEGSAGSLPERAAGFCRAHGWQNSPYQREQSIGGRKYLADVLCADSTH